MVLLGNDETYPGIKYTKICESDAKKTINWYQIRRFLRIEKIAY